MPVVASIRPGNASRLPRSASRSAYRSATCTSPVPTSIFAGYFKWVISGLTSLITLMPGYYVGNRQGRNRGDDT
jgi:hypothetical protein